MYTIAYEPYEPCEPSALEFVWFVSSQRDLKLGANPDRNVRAIFCGIPNITRRFDVNHKFHLLTMHEKVYIRSIAVHTSGISNTICDDPFHTKNTYSFRFRAYYVLVRYEISLLVYSPFLAKPVVSSAMHK